MYFPYNGSPPQTFKWASPAAVQYDAAKDAKEQRERKEKQLKRTEEAKKKAEESKGIISACSLNSDMRIREFDSCCTWCLYVSLDKGTWCM